MLKFNVEGLKACQKKPLWEKKLKHRWECWKWHDGEGGGGHYGTKREKMCTLKKVLPEWINFDQIFKNIILQNSTKTFHLYAESTNIIYSV